jgi:hypothetical protein
MLLRSRRLGPVLLRGRLSGPRSGLRPWRRLSSALGRSRGWLCPPGLSRSLGSGLRTRCLGRAMFWSSCASSGRGLRGSRLRCGTLCSRRFRWPAGLRRHPGLLPSSLGRSSFASLRRWSLCCRRLRRSVGLRLSVRPRGLGWSSWSCPGMLSCRRLNGSIRLRLCVRPCGLGRSS